MNHLHSLSKLLIYRNVLEDKIFLQMMQLESSYEEYELASKLLVKAEEVGLAGNLAKEYIFHLLSDGDNLLSRIAERLQGNIGESLKKAAAHDIVLLRNVLNDSLTIFKEPLMNNYQPTTNVTNKSIEAIKKYFIDYGDMDEFAAVEGLCNHYNKYGYGILADYMAFKWDEEKNTLVGVNSCDEITFDDLIGYDRQKEELISNTEAFLKGLPANNVLLYGERGTGKSSSIKALANKFFIDGLRLIEVSRSQFSYIPAIMSNLKKWGKKFILCLDDLSFEEFEVEYKQLKSIIEGGIETKPDNVLIYATSNRRNIVKEVWADNEGDELHRTDTINEKISLGDRFGLKIFFISPNQEAYLNIIREKARRAGLSYSEEKLRQEAIKWEMSHSGRSGRIAEQLIVYLLGREGYSKN